MQTLVYTRRDLEIDLWALTDNAAALGAAAMQHAKLNPHCENIAECGHDTAQQYRRRVLHQTAMVQSMLHAADLPTDE